MKKRTFILLLASLVTGFTFSQSIDKPADATGMDEDAHSWTNDIKMGWNLGNALESAGADWDDKNNTWTNIRITDFNEWETGWGNPKTTKEMLAAVRDAGFDAIRIPVRWFPHVTDQTTMAVDSKWMARVKQIVDWCMDLNLKVILNTHHEFWLEYHPTYDRLVENSQKLSSLWKQIATEFRDYNGNLAFAGINEVQVNWQAPTTENTSVMNSYNQAFVDAVRATGGKNYYRNLIVQTYSCNPQYGLQGLVIPTDKVENRLSVEFHYYSPYSYCSGDGNYYYWGTAYSDKGNIPMENEKVLKNLFTQIKKQWYDKGLGVIIGEYGVSDHYEVSDMVTQQENMQYYLKCVLSEARRHGFAGFVWDNNSFGNGKEKFGIFNRNNNMSVDETYFLNGIKEGSVTAYDENSSEDETTDNYVGTTFWTGNEALNWDKGFQLNIPANNFSDFTENSKLVLSYTTDDGASYNMIQLMSGTWEKLTKILIDGYASTESQFTLIPATGIQSTAISFDATTLTTLKSVGIYIQGYGAHLTKVLLSDGTTGIHDTHCDEMICPGIYSLDGKNVKTVQNHHIYIRNGRKYVASK